MHNLLVEGFTALLTAEANFLANQRDLSAGNRAKDFGATMSVIISRICALRK
jgi:hypothetical protein